MIKNYRIIRIFLAFVPVVPVVPAILDHLYNRKIYIIEIHKTLKMCKFVILIYISLA